MLHFNRVTRPGWRFNGQVLKRRSFSRFQLRIFDSLVPLWRRIDRFFPWPAVSVIAVGRVPERRIDTKVLGRMGTSGSMDLFSRAIPGDDVLAVPSS